MVRHAALERTDHTHSEGSLCASARGRQRCLPFRCSVYQLLSQLAQRQPRGQPRLRRILLQTKQLLSITQTPRARIIGNRGIVQPHYRKNRLTIRPSSHYHQSNLLNIIDFSKESEVVLVCRVELDSVQKFPPGHAALRADPLRFYEVFAETANSAHLVLKESVRMKVLGLAELLELIVDGLRFRHV
jgi:hypothetical protein